MDLCSIPSTFMTLKLGRHSTASPHILFPENLLAILTLWAYFFLKLNYDLTFFLLMSLYNKALLSV